jgi:hypothetical protein
VEFEFGWFDSVPILCFNHGNRIAKTKSMLKSKN